LFVSTNKAHATFDRVDYSVTSSAVFTAAKPLQKIFLEKRPKGRGIRPLAHYVRNDKISWLIHKHPSPMMNHRDFCLFDLTILLKR